MLRNGIGIQGLGVSKPTVCLPKSTIPFRIQRSFPRTDQPNPAVVRIINEEFSRGHHTGAQK